MTLFEACRKSNCDKAVRQTGPTGRYAAGYRRDVYVHLVKLSAPISLENFRIIAAATDHTVIRRISLSDFTRTDWAPVFVTIPGARL